MEFSVLGSIFCRMLPYLFFIEEFTNLFARYRKTSKFSLFKIYWASLFSTQLNNNSSMNWRIFHKLVSSEHGEYQRRSFCQFTSQSLLIFEYQKNHLMWVWRANIRIMNNIRRIFLLPCFYNALHWIDLVKKGWSVYFFMFYRKSLWFVRINSWSFFPIQLE